MEKINRNVRVGLTVLLLSSLYSCDCLQLASGTVLDKGTGKPLEDVSVCNKYKTWQCALTDSTGFFELGSISGGLFGCPPMKVIVKADNYKERIIAVGSAGNRRIKLRKEKH